MTELGQSAKRPPLLEGVVMAVKAVVEVGAVETAVAAAAVEVMPPH